MARMEDLAETFHKNYEVHHGGNSLNHAANFRVIMAIRSHEFFEALPPAGAQKYGWPRTSRSTGGARVHAPSGPGSGHSSTST